MTNGFQSNVIFNQDGRWFKTKITNGLHSNGMFCQDD